MFRLKESLSGQLLNHVWGTLSESAYLWDPKMFTTVREPNNTWRPFSWTMFEVHQVKVHIFGIPKYLQQWENQITPGDHFLEPCLRHIKWKCTFLGSQNVYNSEKTKQHLKTIFCTKTSLERRRSSVKSPCIISYLPPLVHVCVLWLIA
jgi:hypothetical protein